MTDQPDPEHRRPDGVDDATVEGLGTLSEALEVVEEARGLLYAFHRRTGHAHLTLVRAIDQLTQAGHPDLADELQDVLLGRNVLHGRWTFQIVEEYDDGYYSTFKQLEQQARDRLVGGRRHLYEAEMKEREWSSHAPHHEAVPDQGG